MNVTFNIPDELQPHIDAQLQTGAYGNAVDYLLHLVHQDWQRKQAQEKLEGLLQEGLASGEELVTPAYWQTLRTSVLGKALPNQ